MNLDPNAYESDSSEDDLTPNSRFKQDYSVQIG